MKKISLILVTGAVGILISSSVFAEDLTSQSTETSVYAVEESNVESSEQEVSSDTVSESETNQSTDAREAAPQIQEEVEELIGKKKGEDVPVDSKPGASKIRESLLAEDYGLAKEELDKYTDEQLEQAMTLFTRYNYDITGMDYGSYARLLKTLFNDKTVDVNDALTQLVFDPSSYTSFSSMIPDVELLKNYLDTLYPVNSTFIPGLGLSAEELVDRLNNLQKMEDELISAGQSLSFGRIAGLISKDICPTIETSNTTSSSTSNDLTSGDTSVSKQHEVSKEKDNLPKTGEKVSSIGLIGLGILIITAITFVFFKGKKFLIK